MHTQAERQTGDGGFFLLDQEGTSQVKAWLNLKLDGIFSIKALKNKKKNLFCFVYFNQ